jgi:hypothetical protein
MTALTDDETAAQLLGAAKAWAEQLRLAMREVYTLSDQPHSRPVREALSLAAAHVRTAAVLLEATAEVAEPHRSEQARALDEEALTRRIVAARL